MVLYHLSGAPPSAGAQRNFLTEQTANIAGNGTFHVLFLHFLLHIVAGLNIWGVCVGGGGWTRSAGNLCRREKNHRLRKARRFVGIYTKSMFSAALSGKYLPYRAYVAEIFLTFCRRNSSICQGTT